MDYPKTGSIIDGKWEILDVLGEGGTAFVLKCRDIRNGRMYALKRFFPDKMSRILQSRIFDESKLTVKSYYIAKVIKTFKTDGYFHQLLHFLPGRDLSDILNTEDALDEVTSVYFILCMTRAVADLNAAHPAILITDLKPENSRIIDPSCKLVVFDLSCFEYVGKKPEFSLGTAPYAPPELTSRETLWQSTDIFSIVVVLFEMLVGRERFNDISDKWDIELRRGYKPDISIIEDIYPEAWRIIYSGIDPDPSKRIPNANVLLSLLVPYYQSITGYKITPANTNKVILICQNGKRLCLREGTTVIGRNLLDPYNFFISESHCEITIDKKTNVLIRDIGSKTGTIVKGKRIDHRWVKLNDSDLIQIANVPVQIRIA